MRKKWFKKRKSENLHVDEVFFDSFQLEKNDFSWEERIEESISPRFIKAVWFFVGVIFLFFGGKVAYLSILNEESFKIIAQNNYVKEVWEKPARGIIYSNDLKPLVKNESIFNLVAIPAEISRDYEKQEDIINFLQNTFKKERKEIVSLFNNMDRFSFRPIPLFNDISQEKLIIFRANKEKLPGLRLEEDFKRVYLESLNFSHILGYTGLTSLEDLKNKENYLLTDQIGKSGIELYYEDFLRGRYGKTEKEITSIGQEGRELSSEPSESGKNLILFIDYDLQKKVTEIVSKHFQERGFSRGAVVVMDPRSGGVLAMQSFPLYNNNKFSEGIKEKDLQHLFQNIDKPLFNRVVGGLYPSGSIIKPYIAVAGLEEDIINEDTTVNVTGSIRVAGQEFHDWRLHGVVDLRKALAVSSNVFFYSVGGGYGEIEGLGPYLIKEYLKKFGLGSLTNIDFPGEKRGIVPDPNWKKENRREEWFIGDTYNISIGQGDLLVTPLQMTSALSAIANDGVLLKPRIVKSIANEDLTDFTPTTPEITRRNIVSRDSLNPVKEGMRMVVTEGSAGILENLPVKVAGKTGTAQSQEGKNPHAWFTSFAPYKNPEIVMSVIVEHGGGGSQVAVPITYDILNWYFNR